jgi:hypothetical protein
MEDSSQIAHLKLVITDQIETINKQRCRIAELEYFIDRHDLLYFHPWRYFFWRIFVWPFVRKEGQR